MKVTKEERGRGSEDREGGGEGIRVASECRVYLEVETLKERSSQRSRSTKEVKEVKD